MTPDALATPTRRPAWLIPVIVALVVIVAVTTWRLVFAGSSTIDVNGDLTVTSTSSVSSDKGVCTTSGGYADVKLGAQFVITDAAGSVVATAVLGPGQGVGGSCRFAFHAEVPSGSDFYGLELGRRGVVQYSADQLAAGPHLTLGD